MHFENLQRKVRSHRQDGRNINHPEVEAQAFNEGAK
jgi:hypothetical protein